MFVMAAFVGVGVWGKQSHFKPHEVSDFLEYLGITKASYRCNIDWGVVAKYIYQGRFLEFIYGDVTMFQTHVSFVVH